MYAFVKDKYFLLRGAKRQSNIGLTFKPGRALRGVGAILAPSHNADLLYVDSQES